ncbi:MAG: hypothetical protein H0U56_01575 [Methylibium sp.]|nr:hypothetical protein [Methylibium sp.]MBA3589583.1 hypothetical protein [Methylibium sp.]
MHAMFKTFIVSVALLGASSAFAQTAASPIPSFTATALSGKKVTADKLIGQPTILIVTPSKEAAEDTRLWAKALRKNIDQQAIRVRDVLAIDLPFFMSESDAIGRAKKKIPARYYDQTWILAETDLEKALNIPTNSRKAFVIVLDAEGKIVARVEGEPTEARLNEVQSAVQSIKP